MEIALKTRYKNEIRNSMQEKFAYANPMAIPKIEKIVINMGLGDEVREDSKVLEKATQQLTTISLQRPVVTKAKKSVSNFKIRDGMPVGLMVTLRGARMWIFLEKLIQTVLPRVRDFRGISANAFDGRGNYNLGIKDQAVFPDLGYDMIDKVRGMDIAIVTSAKNDEEARSLLEFLGMPFRK